MDLHAELAAARQEIARLRCRLRILRDCADPRCHLCAMCLNAADFTERPIRCLHGPLPDRLRQTAADVQTKR